MSKKQKISVVLLTRNEEAMITDCLKSVSWADEVVVVDSGSTDRTVSLCCRPKVRVFNHPWCGFGKQRDFAVKMTRFPWVLSLDADERVSAELAEEIKKTLAHAAPETAYRIPFKNILMGTWLRHGGMYPDTHLRLFHKKYGRFNHNPVHESIEIKGQEVELQAPMIHLVSRDLAHYIEKLNRYTDSEAAILFKNQVSPTGYDLFVKPKIRFFNSYVSRRGFLDGVPGFIYAFLRSLYFFLVYVKLYEKRGWRPSAVKILLTLFHRNKKESQGYPSQAYSQVRAGKRKIK